MTAKADATLLPHEKVPRRDPKQAERLSRISRLTAGRLRRSTLVTLRWMAILGQSLALLIVWFVLEFTYPIKPAVLIIALSAVLNFYVTFTLPLDRRVSDFEAAVQLGFDSVQLAILLWLTGGMSNPFSILFLAPVVTSATTLSRPVIVSLSCLVAGLSFALLFTSLALPWDPVGSFELPFLFKLGVWFAIMVGIGFTSLYAWTSARESRRMSEALAATEAVLAHEQKLSALGGLAAAAAHELGTPLATIQLVAKEIDNSLRGQSELKEDVTMILSQTQRCRNILQQLAVRGDEGDLIHDRMSLEALLEEAAQPFMEQGADIDISVAGPSPAPNLRRQAELIFGVRNLIENAVGFAKTQVVISGEWTPDHIKVEILDDGPGFDSAIRDRLGEPYVSSRSLKSKAGGMGLGVFIAKTLIERTGGQVNFANRNSGGASVTLKWSINALTLSTP